MKRNSRAEGEILADLRKLRVDDEEDACANLALQLIDLGKTLSDDGRTAVLEVLAKVEHQGSNYVLLLETIREKEMIPWLDFLERFDLPEEGQSAEVLCQGWLIALQVIMMRHGQYRVDEKAVDHFLKSSRLYRRVLKFIERLLEEGEIDQYTLTCASDLLCKGISGLESGPAVIADWFLRFGLSSKKLEGLLLELLLEVSGDCSEQVVNSLLLDALFVSPNPSVQEELRREALMRILEEHPPCDEVSVARLVAIVERGLRGESDAAQAVLAATLLRAHALSPGEQEDDFDDDDESEESPVLLAQRARLQRSLGKSRVANLEELKSILYNSVVFSEEVDQVLSKGWPKSESDEE